MQHPRHLISESNDSTLCQLLLSVMKTSLTFRSTIKRDQKHVKTLGATFKLDVRSSFFSTPELFNFITAYQCKSSKRRTSQVHQWRRTLFSRRTMGFPSDRASYPTKGTLKIMIVYQAKQVLVYSCPSLMREIWSQEMRKRLTPSNCGKIAKITQKTVAK